ADCHQHLTDICERPDSLSEYERNSFAGPCQELLDHPAILSVLCEVIGPDVSEHAYGFRCDASTFDIRAPGWRPQPSQGPHNGGPMEPTHTYDFRRGRIFNSS